MLSKSAAVQLVGDQLLQQWRAERERLQVIDDWARGKNPEPWKPRTANGEYKALQKRALSPILSLIVATFTQATIADGFRSPRSGEDSPAWKIWQANGFDARQVALHRGTYQHGLAYVTVLPGEMSDGSPMPVARGVSARKMLAVYQDPAEDEWPMYALRGDVSGNDLLLGLWDEGVIHRLSVDKDGDKPEYITYDEHGFDVPPVVRFSNGLDLDGRTMGEVEPYIPIAARIDQVTADRLMVQRFASWKVRTVSGMAKPETPADADAEKLRLRQDDLLVAANHQTKFGTLDESPMDGFIKAGEFDLRLLSSVAQVSPTTFAEGINNVSAEGIALTLEGHQRKLRSSHLVLGESHEQWLTLAGSIAGVEVDPAAQIQWRDVEARSLAQMADAFGKIADQLQFPAQILWDKLPFLTQTDIEEAKRLVERGDSLQQLMETLERQADGPAVDGE